MKPGHRTTEFWVTAWCVAAGVAAEVAGIGLLYAGLTAGLWLAGIGAIEQSIAAGWYAHSRGREKAAAATPAAIHQAHRRF